MDHKLSPDTRLSLYRNIKTTSEKDGPPVTVTLSGHLEAIREGKYAGGVNAVRDARGTAAYTQLKHLLPAVCWGAYLPDGRKQSDLDGLTGLVFLDWDQHEGAPNAELREAVKARFAQLEGVVASYTSCGGDGLHIVVAVDPVPTDKFEYAQAWRCCVQKFELRAGKGNDISVKNANRLAIVSADPSAHINLAAPPLQWTPTAGSSAGGGGLLGGASAQTHKTGNAFDALSLIAKHYGVDGPNPEVDPSVGIRLSCPYHGGNNKTSLHLWTELKPYEVKGKKEPQFIAIPHAHCFVECARSQTLLRFLEIDSGVKWPPTPMDKSLRVAAVEIVQDALDLLRLELRMTLPDGSIDVRAKHIDDLPLPGNAFNYGLDGWAPGEEWRSLGAPLEAYMGGVIDTYFDPVGPVKRQEAILSRAAAVAVDPVREWLDSLPPWDGVPRLDDMVVKGLGAEPGPIAAAFGRALVGAVARVRTHGAVHDWMPVLVGPQGIGKSRFCHDLLPPENYHHWWADGVYLDADQQKIMESIGGALIVEFSEMAGLGSADRKFKAFLTKQFDRWRRPYAHNASESGRKWIAVGTCNPPLAIPSDPSGSRRYLVIPCGVDGAVTGETVTDRWNYIPDNRDQLWAEAKYRWDNQDPTKPPPNLLPHALRQEQEETNSGFTAANEEFAELVLALQDHRAAHPRPKLGITIKDLWELAHTNAPAPGGNPSFHPDDMPGAGFRGVPPMRNRDSQGFAAVLKTAGWESKQTRTGPVRSTLWYYPPAKVMAQETQAKLIEVERNGLQQH